MWLLNNYLNKHSEVSDVLPLANTCHRVNMGISAEYCSRAKKPCKCSDNLSIFFLFFDVCMHTVCYIWTLSLSIKIIMIIISPKDIFKVRRMFSNKGCYATFVTSIDSFLLLFSLRLSQFDLQLLLPLGIYLF